MHTISTRILAAAALAALAQASDLDLRLESAGADLVVTSPGASVAWRAVGELSDAANEGLAMFSLDLSFSGGALAPAAAPTSGPMLNFDRPAGFTNPAGFGGTVSGPDLLQVGGAQNTIKNLFAAVPNGTVQTGIGQPGAPVVLAEGVLTAPASPGTYVLSVSDAFVNVIRAGEDGSGAFWAVDGAGLGAVGELTVIVLDCSAANFCEASPNSQGCLATTSTAGTPTLGGADDFRILADGVVNRSFGALFWSTGPADAPFGGGTLCLTQPLQRFGTQMTGGNPVGVDCSGSMDQPVSHLTMTVLGWTPGTTVFTQYLYRDFFDPDGLGLTDGTVFTVCP